MFFRTVLLVHLSAGLVYGYGIIPVDQVHREPGQSVTFPTSHPPLAGPVVARTWSFNKTTGIITSTTVDLVGHGYESRITFDNVTGSLELRNLTARDNGEYEVMIIPYGAEPLLGTVHLMVVTSVSKPTMACPAGPLIEGKTSVNLSCDAEGFVTRVWMKDGRPLVSSDRLSFHDGNRVLSIGPVNRSDTGEFLCKVGNQMGSETSSCGLTIYYGPDAPVISQRPVGAEIEDSVTLLCSADSRPGARFTWRFRHMLMYGPVHYIHEMEEWHLGSYNCTARNEITGVEVSTVHVLRDSTALIHMSLTICAVLTSVGLVLT